MSVSLDGFVAGPNQSAAYVDGFGVALTIAAIVAAVAAVWLPARAESVPVDAETEETVLAAA